MLQTTHIYKLAIMFVKYEIYTVLLGQHWQKMLSSM